MTCALTSGLNRCHYVGEMIFQHCKQQRLLIGIVLIQCAHRDAGTLGDPCCRQSLCPMAQQNLNSRLRNRLHRDRRPRLHGRLSWLKCNQRISRHMRTPNLKNPSSNDCSKEEPMIEQIDLAGSFTLPGTSTAVNRMGYGAMQLAGRDGNKLVWG